MHRRHLAAAIAALLIAFAALPARSAAAGEDGPTAVLDATSYWRVLYSWAPPLAMTDDGPVEMRPKPGRNVCKCDADFNFMTRYPSEG